MTMLNGKESRGAGGWPQTAAGGRLPSPAGHGAKTSAVRERAILALLSERTIERAAKRSGVGARTLRRWLGEDKSFRTEYDAARRTTFQAAMNRIQCLTADAVDTLEDLLRDRKHAAVRLGAARTVMEIGLHQHDADTLIERIEALEATVARNPRG